MPKPRQLVTQPLDTSYRYIALTRGQIAIVDAADFDRLNQWNWNAHWSPPTRSFYAMRNVWLGGTKWITIYMAREILRCPRDKQVDHANHNTLDNRKQNLRIATVYQNCLNRRLRVNSASGFKGVSWHAHSKRWRAQITVNGKHVSLGLFPSKEEAAKAYDVAAKRLHEEFAHTN